MTATSEVRSCGACSLCCKLLFVDALNKPENVWCSHALPPGSGCAIHATKPDGCRNFICNWLADASFPEEWKPERCGIIVSPSLSGRGLRISVDPNKANAWKNEPFYSNIKTWSVQTRQGTGYVAVFTGAKCFIIFPEEDLEVSTITAGSAVRAGYLENALGRQPVAHIKYANGEIKEFKGAVYPNARA